MTWGPLPPYKGTWPERTGKFIDIEVVGIFASRGNIGDLDITKTLTLTSAGILRSAASGQRVEMGATFAAKVNFHTGHADEEDPPHAVSGTDATKASNRLAIGFTRGEMFSDTALNHFWVVSRDKANALNGGFDVFVDEVDVVYDATGTAPEDAFWQVRKGATVVIKADDNGLVTIPGLTWQTWTPTYTNITVGNGTVVARYTQIGETIHAHWTLTFGSTTSVNGTTVTITSPITASGYTNTRNSVGTAYLFDATGSSHPAFVRLDSTTVFALLPHVASGTYTTLANMSATVPFTWTTSDIMSFSATYEAA